MKIDRRIAQEYYDVTNLTREQFSLIMTALENASDHGKNPCALTQHDMEEMVKIKSAFRKQWREVYVVQN